MRIKFVSWILIPCPLWNRAPMKSYFRKMERIRDCINIWNTPPSSVRQVGSEGRRAFLAHQFCVDPYVLAFYEHQPTLTAALNIFGHPARRLCEYELPVTFMVFSRLFSLVVVNSVFVSLLSVRSQALRGNDVTSIYVGMT